MVVEDAPESRRAVRNDEPHFKVFPEFAGASYLKRYDLFCQRLVKEQLYTATALLASPRTAAESGDYMELSELSSLDMFVTGFAGHIAAEAARRPSG